MRKLHKLIPAATLAIASSRAAAQMIYEPFDYGSASVGVRLSDSATNPTFSGLINPMTGYSWFAAATGFSANDPVIGAGNLTSPANSPSSSGNSLSLAGNERGSRLTLNNAGGYGQSSGATIYYSTLLKVTDLTNLPSTVNNTGSFIAGLNNSTGTQTTQPGVVGARLFVRRGGANNDSTTTYQIGTRNNTAVIQWYTAQEFTVGVDSPQVVASYQLVDGGPGNDIGKMWINPASSTYGASVAPAPTLTAIAEDLTATVANAHIDSFYIRGDNALIPAGITLDEIRVDTSWAQVVRPTGNSWIGTTGNNWSDPTKWSAGSVPDAVNTFINFDGAGGTVNVDSARTVGTINFNTTSSYTVSGAALTLDGDLANGGAPVINVLPRIDSVGGGPTVDPILASNHTIASNINYAGNIALNIAKDQTLTLSGLISSSATAPLTKNGGGTLVLTNTGNTFDVAGANIVVNDGTVAVTSDAALGPVPAAPVSKIILNRAALRLDGSFATNVNRNLSILGGANGTFSSIDVTAGNTSTFAGTISGNSLVKTGSGTLVLGNTGNGYTSGTTINAGTVQVSADGNLGGVPVSATNTNVTLNGGTLQFSASFNPSNNRQVSIGAAGGTIDTNGNNVSWGNNIIGSGQLTKAGGGELGLGGSNAYAGGTAIDGGTLSIFNDANLGAAGTGISYGGGALKVFSSFTFSGRPMTVNAGGGTLDTNTFDVVASTIAGAGAFTKNSAGKLTASSIRTGGLTINAGSVELATDGTATGVSKVAALSIDPSAKLDVQNNKVITSTAVGTWNGSNYTGATGLIRSGRNGGGWTGNGIVTSQSQAAAGNLTTIGVASASQVKGVAITATTVWAGQTVSGSDTLVMYTYGGDANLDGKINVDDYTRIDFNVPLGSSGWYNGDFNYDGKINVDDYTIIDFNVGIQGAPFFTSGGTGLSAVAVPEPASLSVLAFGALGLLGRRRRSR
jgi:autotransporter-associated beta strand protein